MFEEQLPPKRHQLPLGVRQVDRLHLFGIDARPDDMGMASPVLFVKDHDARLAGQAEDFLRPIKRIASKSRDGGIDPLGRVEAARIEVLAALGALGRGFRLAQCAHQVSGHEAFHLMDRDMLIVLGVEQVFAHGGCTTALIAVEDHGRSPTPSARISSARISATSWQASCSWRGGDLIEG
jgi:hypothetical protein